MTSVRRSADCVLRAVVDAHLTGFLPRKTVKREKLMRHLHLKKKSLEADESNDRGRKEGLRNWAQKTSLLKRLINGERKNLSQIGRVLFTGQPKSSCSGKIAAGKTTGLQDEWLNECYYYYFKRWATFFPRRKQLVLQLRVRSFLAREECAKLKGGEREENSERFTYKI